MEKKVMGSRENTLSCHMVHDMIYKGIKEGIRCTEKAVL